MKRRLIVALMLLVVGSTVLFGAAVPLNNLWSGLTDTSGQMLSGGKVYTYAAGTTTAKTTWIDSSKGTAAPNPIVLDAYGRATAYFDGNYKLVVQDSAGVTQYTIDNIELVSTVSPTTISVTTATLANATIASLTANQFTLSNGVISSGTLSLCIISAPQILNASISASVIYGGSGTGNIFANITITGGNASLSNALVTNGSFTNLEAANVATPTSGTALANKGYVDQALLNNKVIIAPAYGGFATPVESVAWGGVATASLIPGTSLSYSTDASHSEYIQLVCPMNVIGNNSYLTYSGYIYLADASGSVYDKVFVSDIYASVTGSIAFPSLHVEGFTTKPVTLCGQAQVPAGVNQTFSLYSDINNPVIFQFFDAIHIIRVRQN